MIGNGIGGVSDGLEHSAKGKVSISTEGNVIADIDTSGIRSQQGIIRHKNTISTSVTIASDETAVAAGPLTIDSTGTLEVAAGGIMVIV